MKLNSILDRVKVLESHGDKNVTISGICFDSRSCKKGDLFIALRGSSSDGHQFIGMALKFL
ncbi:MAG: UDP-N-acetylmuramoylalanyl-D-glutamate--2,6-diaminopimelate ligase [Bacteroidetes bacterium]|nr:UDP-N-acetylmuramoylalanyl-D-glutamate--2,6-diaminopimelate ligase [Bacteroidota bacterium]